MTQTLPTGSQERKDVPLARGCLDYFPAALAEVAKLSKAGNDKHNPGEEMHHARGKSMDHADCIMRHLVDRGTVDPEDGIPHSVKIAWRALAMAQEELEAAGEAPLARGARLPEPPATVEPAPDHEPREIPEYFVGQVLLNREHRGRRVAVKVVRYGRIQRGDCWINPRTGHVLGPCQLTDTSFPVRVMDTSFPVRVIVEVL